MNNYFRPLTKSYEKRFTAQGRSSTNNLHEKKDFGRSFYFCLLLSTYKRILQGTKCNVLWINIRYLKSAGRESRLLISSCWETFRLTGLARILTCTDKKKAKLFFCTFFGGLECVGHCFDYFAHFVILRDIWALADQSVTCASGLRVAISVGDPVPQDPHVFRPPESGSIGQRYGYGSRSFPFLK